MNVSNTASVTGRHFLTRRAVRIDLSGSTIEALTELAAADDDLSLPWVAPGLIDIQSNGYGGQEFSSPALDSRPRDDDLRSAGELRRDPVLPNHHHRQPRDHRTCVGDDRGRLPAIAARRALVAGIHVEGPYIAREDGPRGAHPLEHCRPPDWQEFAAWQAAAEGRIRLVTLSPEYPESTAFIAQALRAGITVAIGHTSATSNQIRAAVDAGATLSTHLGNGAHRMLRRHPNYIWDQLADDRLSASLIADGHHLPAEVVQTFVCAKTAERIILVSDLSGLAGLPPGRYGTELCELEILADGRLVIADQDQLLAGASRPIGDGVANVMRFAGVDLPAALAMATCNPARLLGLDAAELRPGARSDLVLFRLVEGPDGRPTRFDVCTTVSLGEISPQTGSRGP